TVLLDPSTTQSTAASVHVGLLGQAVHALWRGGFFDATLDSTDVSGVPAGVSARLTTQLPPAVQIRSGRVELALGAVNVLLTYPTLFAQPINAELGARASMRVQLVGNDLRFDDVRIDELRFSTASVDLDQATRDTVETLLTRILGSVVTSALNDALPAVPIPAFTLPASLSTYGLPGGRDLGLVGPVLTTGSRHFTLAGNFGLR
ncbi:MAG: hypothetical protein IT378_04910, partial [Sandaracinaceae bacterium]|nr:hypothetical protein [Sandaracinaceae bacterium]